MNTHTPIVLIKKLFMALSAFKVFINVFFHNKLCPVSILFQ